VGEKWQTEEEEEANSQMMSSLPLHFYRQSMVSTWLSAKQWMMIADPAVVVRIHHSLSSDETSGPAPPVMAVEHRQN